MATILANSGGHYSSWSTWISDLILLGTFTAVETGQVRNEFNGGDCDLSGVGTTSSFGLVIEGETQFSGSPLRYVDGGRVLFDGNFEAIKLAVDYVTVRNLAIRKSNGYGFTIETASSSRVGLTLQNLVVQTEVNSSDGTIKVNGTTAVDNVLHIRTAGNGNGIHSENGSQTFKNCAAISLNSSSGTGWTKTYGTQVCINCIAYGYSTDWQSGYPTSGAKNNATSKSSGSSNVPGSGTAQFDVVAGDFVSVTNGSHDLRVASGSTKLKDLGAASGGTTTSITGQSISGSARDIGPDEYQASAPAFPIWNLKNRFQRPKLIAVLRR